MVGPTADQAAMTARTRGWKVATFAVWLTLGLVIAATIAGR